MSGSNLSSPILDRADNIDKFHLFHRIKHVPNNIFNCLFKNKNMGIKNVRLLFEVSVEKKINLLKFWILLVGFFK